MNPEYLIDLNGTLFFKSGNVPSNMKLWKSNGTLDGTVQVSNINLGYPGERLVRSNNTLFFSANSGNGDFELWKSDGTSKGTILVKDIYSGVNPSSPSYLTDVNGILYFSANDGINGAELWKSDGTIQGTILVKDIMSGIGNSSPRDLVSINGLLFFTANDGIHGYELWKSDGTAAGTQLVKDANTGVGSSYVTTNMVELNGKIFFYLDDGVHGYRLWKSDGTDAGTAIVKDVNPFHGNIDMPLLNINGTIFFSARVDSLDSTKGWELWKSDGTELGTILVKDIDPGFSSSSPRNFTNVNGTLFFNAFKGILGEELWKSDGTPNGTTMVKDIWEGNWQSSYPDGMFVLNNILYFVANNPTGRDLWKSDGTTSGTAKVADLFSSNYAYFVISNVKKSGNNLYILLTSNSYPSENTLWKSALPTITTIPTTERNNEVTVYPVPTEGRLSVSVGDRFIGGALKIYNMGSELVYSAFITKSSFSLDMNKYISGMYMLVLSQHNEVLIRKIIKN